MEVVRDVDDCGGFGKGCTGGQAVVPLGVVTVVGGDLVVVKNSWSHASTPPDDFTDAWGCRGRFVAGLNSMAGD